MNKLMGRTTVTKLQDRAFGVLLPAAALIEHFAGRPGSSFVAVASRR